MFRDRLRRSRPVEQCHSLPGLGNRRQPSMQPSRLEGSPSGRSCQDSCANYIAETHYSVMKRFLAVLCILVWSVVGFAGTLTKSHSQGKFSDAEIEATIKAKLAKSKIGKDGFQVHVKNGIATWTGSTAVMQHKGAATRMAKTAGAIRVVNNIKVSETEMDKAKSNLTGGAPRHVEVKTN